MEEKESSLKEKEEDLEEIQKKYSLNLSKLQETTQKLSSLEQVEKKLEEISKLVKNSLSIFMFFLFWSRDSSIFRTANLKPKPKHGRRLRKKRRSSNNS